MAAACALSAALAFADTPDGCVDLSPFSADEAALAHFSFDDVPEHLPPAPFERNRTYVTGDVRIVVQPIFDRSNPAENNALYRLADRLHANTRPSTIQEAILFRTGQSVTWSVMQESERILRAKPYFYDARVLPRRLCGDRIDVDVVTRDVWTLLPDADFSRSGGDNSYSYGLTDTNVAGSGRTLSLFYEKDPDRDGTGIYYLNPNVLGSRIAFETRYEDNSDGSRRLVDIGQPFYALDARYAFGARGDKIDQEQGLYVLGDKFAEFAQDYRRADLHGGFSNGQVEGHVWRWLGGYTYEKRTFSQTAEGVPPDPLPQDRKYGYPWLGFESVEDRFDTSFDVDRIHRIEDLNLGRRYSMALGYSTSAFGGDDQDRLVLRSEYRDGLRYGDKHLLFYGAELQGYFNFTTNRSEQVTARASAAYRQQQTGRFSLAATLEAAAVRNLPTDMQLLGGGDTGLRGYPSRYQWGNRSWLASIEQRYFSDVYFGRIVRVGVAAFFDAGRTWFAGASGAGYDTLADVGFGFRFESTRTRQDRVLHLDFAFPLVDGPDVQSMQILLVVKERL